MNCKKCGKPLPEGCKSKLCEACIGKKVTWLKKSAKVLGVCVTIGASIILAKSKNKDD